MYGGPMGGPGGPGGYGPGMHGGYGGFGGPMGGFGGPMGGYGGFGGPMGWAHRPGSLRPQRSGDSVGSSDSNLGIIDTISEFELYMDNAKWSHHTLKLIKDKNAKMTMGTKAHGVLTGTRAFLIGKFRRINFSIKSRAIDDQYANFKINKETWMRKQRNIAYEYYNWLWKIKYFPTRGDVVYAMNEWGSKVALPDRKKKLPDGKIGIYKSNGETVTIPYTDYMNDKDREENDRRIGRSR